MTFRTLSSLSLKQQHVLYHLLFDPPVREPISTENLLQAMEQNGLAIEPWQLKEFLHDYMDRGLICHEFNLYRFTAMGYRYIHRKEAAANACPAPDQPRSILSKSALTLSLPLSLTNQQRNQLSDLFQQLDPGTIVPSEQLCKQLHIAHYDSMILLDAFRSAGLLQLIFQPLCSHCLTTIGSAKETLISVELPSSCPVCGLPLDRFKDCIVLYKVPSAASAAPAASSAPH